jgi:hypothetical protein
MSAVTKWRRRRVIGKMDDEELAAIYADLKRLPDAAASARDVSVLATAA